MLKIKTIKDSKLIIKSQSFLFMIMLMLVNIPNVVGQCDFFEGESISFSSQGGNLNASFSTTYILLNSQGQIIELSSSSSFSSQTMGSYTAYAVNYESVSGITGLQVGNRLSDLSSDCMELSTGLPLTVCDDCSVNLGADQTVCEGQMVVLTASGSSGSYSWSTGATGSSTTISANSTATYRVTVTTSDGCEAEDEVTVFVNPVPTVSAGSDQTICNGSQATLTASGNADSYMWSDGQSGQSIQVRPFTTTTYTVTAMLNGCASTDQVVVNVGGDCGVCELYSCPPSDECSYCTSEDIVVNLSNGNSQSGFTDVVVLTDWNGTILDIITGTNFGPQSAGSYAVFAINYETGSTVTGLEVGRNIFDVRGDCMDISSPYTFNVCESRPVSIQADQNNICAGESVILTANAPSDPGFVSYLWSTGQTSSQITVSPTSTTTYTVTVVDQNMCSSTESIEVVVMSCGLCENYTCPPVDQCDFEEDEPLTLDVSNGNTASGYTTVFALVDSDGMIESIYNSSNIGLLDVGLHSIFPINYLDNSSINGMTVGRSIFEVSGSCLDVGEPYIFRVCQRTVLPIELIDFDGYRDESEKVNVLFWSTASEIDNDYFELERTMDIQSGFEVIGRVEGNGTSTEELDYEYIDRDVNRSGIYYYRLKQVDYNGTWSYEPKIVTIEVELASSRWDNMKLNIYPNPTDNLLNIELEGMEVTSDTGLRLEMYSIDGVLKKTKELANNKNTISTEYLPSGTYILKLISEDGRVWVNRVSVTK